MRRWLLIVLALPAAPACTLSAGDWFANLQPSFEARYATRADRDVGDGWQKLNTLYEVRLTSALVTIDDVELHDVGGGAAGAGFDPANPPAGYSLCHNGHCHRDDGALVPYEDIAAEISGGGMAVTRTVVTLPVGEENLLAPARRALACEPGCGLPRANIQRARATVTRVALEGQIREGRLPARLEGDLVWRWEAALATDTGLEPVSLDCAAELPADNAHPANVRLGLTLELGARLFDDIDWAALARDPGVIDLSAAANAAARDVLRANLAEGELTAAIQRSD
jgi:hypothetical protein